MKDRFGEGTTLNNLGYAYHGLQQFEKAIEYYDQSFIRLTRKGEPNLFIFKHDIKYIQEVG